MKTLLCLFLACASLSAFAGVQPDGVANGGTNVCVTTSTNTYDNTAIDATKTTDLILEGQAVNVATTNTVTFTWSASLNQDVWITNAIVMNVTGKGIGTAAVTVGMTNPPAGYRYPFWRFSQVWNTNAVTLIYTNVQARAFTKTGI